MIALTGATGVLGRVLIDQLADQPYTAYSGDVRDKNELSAWIKRTRPTHVLHLAAVVPIAKVNSNPLEAYDVNTVGTNNVLQVLSDHAPDAWFMLASTSHVYASSTTPLSEDAALAPQSIYGETKLLAEEITEFFRAHAATRSCIARIFSFYHETQHPPFLYPTIRARLRTHQASAPFEVVNGLDIRDMLSAEQVAQQLAALLRSGYVGTVNVGSGIGTKIEDFVRTVAGPTVTVVSRQERDPSILVADISRLDGVLGR